MKNKLIAFLMFTCAFVSAQDTLFYFQLNPVTTPVQKEVFLYPGEMVNDTISEIEFTYIKNRTLKHRKGYLINSSQLWTSEPGGGQVVLKKSQEFYVLSDVSMRYEIKNLMVGKVLCNSQTKERKGIFKIFKRKPEYVWEIKLI